MKVIDESFEKHSQTGNLELSHNEKFMTKSQFEKAVEELLKEFKNQLIEEFKKNDIIENTEIQKIKPSHGPCCTCQICGYGYEECMCHDNEIIETILNIEVKNMNS